MIKTIVAPTDGSDHAGKAVDLAADIASRYGARLVILHALLRDHTTSDIRKLSDRYGGSEALQRRLDDLDDAMIQAAGIDEAPFPAPLPADVLTEIAERITTAAREAAEAKGAGEVTVQIVDGSPAGRILDAARAENADMIVMGCRGLGDLAGLLMGSVSHKVNHLAECTCVTVK